MTDYIEELKEGQTAAKISTRERIEGAVGLITFAGFCLTVCLNLT